METQLRIWRNFCSHGICTRWQLHGKDEKREQIQVEALYFLFMFNRENVKEVYSTFDWGSDGGANDKSSWFWSAPSNTVSPEITCRSNDTNSTGANKRWVRAVIGLAQFILSQHHYTLSRTDHAYMIVWLSTTSKTRRTSSSLNRTKAMV